MIITQFNLKYNIKSNVLFNTKFNGFFIVSSYFGPFCHFSTNNNGISNGSNGNDNNSSFDILEKINIPVSKPVLKHIEKRDVSQI
jgi:hypothetical protein